MNIASYTQDFFKTLTMDADENGKHSYGIFLSEAVKAFNEKGTIETAQDVYKVFFDCYKLKLKGTATFVDLLDTLLHYEKNAATLIDKQRDHYIHSVGVFALGLSVYSQNKRFAECFAKVSANPYNGRKTTSQEEFLFRWGVASLFHDIGYPVEIMNNQLKKFISFVSVLDARLSADAKPFIEYGNFAGLNSIEKLIWEENFVCETAQNHEIGIPIDFYSPLDLLVYNFCRSFSIDPPAAKNALQNYLSAMQQKGFVDHGFYSAIILLKWYGFMVQKGGYPSELLFGPVLDAAGAILLHNCYKNMLMKAPFNLGALDPAKHPIAFMLILCDELQEWNRPAYGILDKARVLPYDADVQISQDSFLIHYKTRGGTMAEEFPAKKRDLLTNVLRMENLFPECVTVTSSSLEEAYIGKIEEEEGDVLPRPLIENLEEMAKIIHDNYNKVQLERNPGVALRYPTWDSLPGTLKYSNLRQAKGVFEKIAVAGFLCVSADDPEYTGHEEVHTFSADMIEILARLEKERWNEERIADGWVYGEVRDADKKTTPYLVTFDELSEDIKELDRDAVRNVFQLVKHIGMKAVKP